MADMEKRVGYERWAETGVAVVGIAMLLYHLVNTQYFILGGVEHINIHLGFALLLIFLGSYGSKKRMARFVALALALLSVASIVYVGILYDDLETRAMFNTTTDLFIGAILIVVVIEATRRAFGIVLPLVAVCSIAYFFFGRYLPGAFQTAAISPMKIIPALSIALTGIYGVALDVSASYIFLFVIFGTLLQVSGATGFFMELGKMAGRKVRSGPAMSSVITSALVGTTTGSIGANIITTGSFTIPLMKSVGYKPEHAAAIEAAASNGGQIMPPVMGAAAFAMAAITGFSYLNIIVAALIPATLYFGVAGLYTLLQAMRLGISHTVEEVNFKEMLLRAPLFLLPLTLIIYLLVLGKPLMYCAFWAIVTAVVLSLFRRETRPSLRDWVKGFVQGTITGAHVGAACACLGLILETLTGTGLGVKLPALVEAWSGGNIIIALLITAIASIILGMGVSTVGVYLLVAIVTAPVLLKMGLGMLQAHFFVFFFAVFAMVTPPIGMAAILSSKVAGAKYLPTAIESVKVSLAGFVLPFLIIWNPELLLQPSGSPLPLILLRLMACVVLLVAFEISLVGYFLREIKLWEKCLLILSVAAIAWYFIIDKYTPLLIGFALFLAITIVQVTIRKREV